MKQFAVSVSFTIFLFFNHSSFCQSRTTTTDTTFTHPKRHQSQVFRTAAVPSVLIGYGLFTVKNHGFPYNSYDAYRDVRKQFPTFHTSIDNYTTVVPGIAVYALNIAGIKGKHNFKDRTILYALSSTIALGTTQVLKVTVDRLRPDSTTYNSFPSGHTTAAFVSAEFMHQEFKDESIWYSIGGYTVATATGVMRMLNNRHWLSDVLVGAGIGMLSTKVVYLVYPLVNEKLHHRNTNGVKSWDLGMVPVFYGKGGGLAVVCIF